MADETNNYNTTSQGPIVVYRCDNCRKLFSSSQALAGHQHLHKVQGTWVKSHHHKFLLPPHYLPDLNRFIARNNKSITVRNRGRGKPRTFFEPQPMVQEPLAVAPAPAVATPLLAQALVPAPTPVVPHRGRPVIQPQPTVQVPLAAPVPAPATSLLDQAPALPLAAAPAPATPLLAQVPAPALQLAVAPAPATPLLAQAPVARCRGRPRSIIRPQPMAEAPLAAAPTPATPLLVQAPAPAPVARPRGRPRSIIRSQPMVQVPLAAAPAPATPLLVQGPDPIARLENQLALFQNRLNYFKGVAARREESTHSSTGSTNTITVDKTNGKKKVEEKVEELDLELRL
uniref:Predicted GPI-anchored protein 58 n=1 Tax=Nicotiana tabacum TaxID=4097 RepID=A0A1S4CQ95_TOBAC|nr:PREDICTED: predicted GPI-anchored protein 58 [Nicotiana tabacum]